MATVKTTSGEYTITVAGGVGTLTINANVDIVGNITYIESSELKVDDTFILVAANNASGGENAMGLVATKPTTPQTWAGLRFSALDNQWEISTSVNEDGSPIAPYAPISAGGSIGGSNTQVQFNDDGFFGGNANFTFDYTTSELTLVGHEVYGNIATTPAYTGNGVAVYNKEQGAGGTRLYVKNSTVDDELVSRSKAIIFGIIF